MEINESTLRMMIIFLMKIEEFDACEAMMGVYKRHFEVEEKKPELRLADN